MVNKLVKIGFADIFCCVGTKNRRHNYKFLWYKENMGVKSENETSQSIISFGVQYYLGATLYVVFILVQLCGWNATIESSKILEY